MGKAFHVGEGQDEGPGIGHPGQTEGSASSLKNLGAGELGAERGQ